MQSRTFWKKALAVLLVIMTMAVPVYAEEAKNGPVLNQETGVVEYYKDGVIDTTVTDVVTFGEGKYYIQNGVGSLDFTGLVKAPSEGWVYIENGKFREDLSGFARNNYGVWYYENGRVLFDKTSIIKGEVDGKTKWWRVEKNQVNFKYNGIAKNENGYFMIKKGKVNWKYTGIAKYGKSKWYVKKGKVQKQYSGKIKVKGKTYRVKNGKVLTGKAVTGAAMDVKAQTYSSPTGYLILVNRNKTKVGVYKRTGGKWKAAKLFSCCVGAKGSPTPTGKFRVGIKGAYFNTGSGGRCWNYTQIRGNILFHSQIYDRQSAPNRIIDGRMNRWCSHGCIRLYLKDAKWIYNNVPAGTTIVIY